MSDAPLILIGMFDSPFVRRVAISLHALDLRFEHRNWSVGKDFDKIQRYNPLGRVPTLVLPDGTALVESAAILDYLDELIGAERALLPPAGVARRDALRIIAVAVGAAEKGVLQIYETVFRPADKRHDPWVERCRRQMHAALTDLERICAARVTQEWLTGPRMMQADITVACVSTFLTEALGIRAAAGEYPSLFARVGRCEASPIFQAVKAAFAAPVQSAP
jgi:glutathione S-transferase